MNPERWIRIKKALAEAEALPEPDRSAFVASLDSDIGGEIKDLIAASTTEGLLDAAPSGNLVSASGLRRRDSPAEDPLIGTRVGPYRIESILGKGGMGDVYRASRADGLFERDVALKMVRADANREMLMERFASERHALASLQHSGIAGLLEAGTVDDGPAAGRPWLAMELADGEKLTEYVRRHGSTRAHRVRLLADVAEAVHHAHQSLIVHRDLKPANVLVVDDELGAHPVLLDFGVAKILDPDHATDLTLKDHARPLTRAYAAPEQLRGEPATTATDVYALGLLLFEVISGARPFSGADGPLAMEQSVLHQDPPRPSSVTDSQLAGLPASELRGDLDAICLQALAKKPADRYSSAAAFAADLRRTLDGMPIEARPPTARYRMQRFVGRHKALVATGSLLLLAIVGGTGATLWQAGQARASAAESEATATFLADLFAASDPLAAQRRDTLAIGELLLEGAASVRTELGDQPRVQARLLAVLGRTLRATERWAVAETLLTESAAIYRRVGVDAATLSLVLSEIASVQTSRGNREASFQNAEEALRLARSSRDERALVDAELAMGQAALRSPQPETAEALFLSAQRRIRKRRPSDPIALADAEAALGDVYLNSGQADEAQGHIEAAIAIVEAAAGPYHPRLVGLFHNLAVAHLFAGRPDQTEVAASRAVDIARRAGSRDRLGQVLTAHGQALRRLGRLDEAESRLREALPLFTRRESDPAITLGALASVLDDKGDLAGAIENQRASFELLLGVEAGADGAAASSAIKLAGFLIRARQFGEAERHIETADSILKGIERTDVSVSIGRRGVAKAYVDLFDAQGLTARADEYRAAAANPRRPGTPSHGL